MKRTEKIILSLIFSVIIVGVLIALFEKLHLFSSLLLIDGKKSFFKKIYTREDGLVEWLQFAGLVAGALLCFYRFLILRGKRSLLFLLCTFVLGGMFFFVAGEEISWGQRIFDVKSSIFFAKNNTQGETNLHNLKLGGIRLNKLIFGLGATLVFAFYLLGLPQLYKKKRWLAEWIDRLACPIPRKEHLISFVAILILYYLTLSSKRGELLEVGGYWVLFLITYNPFNAHIFDSNISHK
ncbi:MAG: hypothetical protein A2504_04775 [Bdellovibrionales bacterium RIFOXYD12_FULL_39_22]|nr:MAG: hypothetical protein A2385_07050 [Bdellovibrionales bacterium RIFOXYB1_FULL_39_21]OFZ42020.1 MAG: hypothetical protein A2485_09020 [Bdellovibrionales bacterium RIFOXYC12_FULL_39_17]OFZ50736.1 MAG: hypothetical protein A2404_05970 [Bdellovibrionales bacterium RIFOXYC1_FULL_39_130]OFZ77959.1 MAG: hypothetical protein A2560_01140 [Bdellovibrionales bacterium RIFOXYD1_FULL_39_84]OFZ93605.1 MAG: hypothetical protein A2504_04775 [Bdellovibrionales bacterium RIFOXYD12_FULL_39_22]HLE10271.1 hy